MNRMEAQSEAAQPVPWEVDVVCYDDGEIAEGEVDEVRVCAGGKILFDISLDHGVAEAIEFAERIVKTHCEYTHPVGGGTVEGLKELVKATWVLVNECLPDQPPSMGAAERVRTVLNRLSADPPEKK